MSENPTEPDNKYAVDSDEDARLMARSMPAAIRAAQDRRLVLIQLQHWVAEITTIVVSVPAILTDNDLKSELTHIYELANVDSHAWCTMEDYDPKEGEHEVTGEASPGMKVDLDYLLEKDDDDAE